MGHVFRDQLSRVMVNFFVLWLFRGGGMRHRCWARGHDGVVPVRDFPFGGGHDGCYGCCGDGCFLGGFWLRWEG